MEYGVFTFVVIFHIEKKKKKCPKEEEEKRKEKLRTVQFSIQVFQTRYMYFLGAWVARLFAVGDAF